MDRNKIDAVLEDVINPKLLEHQGWVELVEIPSQGEIVIRFRGACSGCEATQSTLNDYVIPTLREQVPEIREVYVSEGISQELYDLAKQLMSKPTSSIGG